MLENTSTKNIISLLNINNSKFQVYRRRLIDIGVIDGSSRGSLSFALLRFKEYVAFQKAVEEE